MSAGPFERSKYESNDGEIYSIRVQPETLALTLGGSANAAPTGAVTQEVSARVSGGNRQIGLKARAVSLAWTGTPPTGYKAGELVRVPILTEDLYDSVTGNGATTGTYLGVGVAVVGKLPERVR